MIEIIDLKKRYKSKKGPDQQALNGINMVLEDKGFVVILGRSGSGKSTLLNILGGLDKFDSGEIIIKGKSTKDFKSSEWDAYRNTYVGFIFQEFYIIDEFTLGKNIALALELQGYKSEEISERVSKILKSIDLEGYEDRRTNEISGGEEQRIAIARALVKNPEILLVDEPTGNLDSGTGKVILETLKELSKEKLVIMVTHDIEFAREYGDRIIELEDGEIINDTLNNDAVESKIIDNNSSDKLELKKSSLNFGSTFKLSRSSLFTKKLRLLLMMFLFVMSLIFVGVSSNLAFHDPYKAAYLTFEKAGINRVALVKETNNCSTDSFCKEKAISVTEDDIISLRKEYKNIKFTEVVKANIPLYPESENLVPDGNISEDYLEISKIISNLVLLDDISKSKNNYDIIFGSTIKEPNDILITDFVAQALIDHNVFASDSYQEIIGQNYNIGNIEVIIAGIIDTDFEKYNEHKAWGSAEYLEYSGFINDVELNYSTIIGSKDIIDDFINESDFLDKSVRIDFMGKDYYGAPNISKTNVVTNMPLLVGELPENNNEVVIPLSWFINYLKEINGKTLTYEEIIADPSIFELEVLGKDASLSYSKYSYDSSVQVKEDFKIVGIYDDIMINQKVIIFNDDKFKEIYENEMFKAILADLSNSDNENIRFLKDLDDLNYITLSKYSETLDKLIDISMKTKSIFYVTAGIFASFAAIMIFAVISSSITAKKKDIGTLRAIGASGIEVSKIFILEGLIITLIAATIATSLMNKVINYVNVNININFNDNFNGELVLLYINIMSIIFTVLLGIFVTILASLIPVMKIALMKPIDAIKNT